jgi:hypothetical protein
VRPTIRSLALDRRFVGWAAAWSVIALLTFGLVVAIVPNPVFGRQVAPEPFAVAVWILSAPLMGILGATYTARPRPPALIPVQPLADPDMVTEHDTTALGTIGSLGAFLAIGCPVCNKVVLLLLGASGAMTVYAPLQPAIGAASLLLLAGTIAWRLRLRARGGACPA